MKFIKVTNTEAGNKEAIVNTEEISYVEKRTELEQIGPNVMNYKTHEIHLKRGGEVIDIDEGSYDTLTEKLLEE